MGGKESRDCNWVFVHIQATSRHTRESCQSSKPNVGQWDKRILSVYSLLLKTQFFQVLIDSWMGNSSGQAVGKCCQKLAIMLLEVKAFSRTVTLYIEVHMYRLDVYRCTCISIYKSTWCVGRGMIVYGCSCICLQIHTCTWMCECTKICMHVYLWIHERVVVSFLIIYAHSEAFCTCTCTYINVCIWAHECV